MVVGTLSRAVAHVNFGAIVRSMELRGWALKALDGTARGCVRRSRNIPLEQLVGLESRFRRNGVLSRDESVAAILAAIAGRSKSRSHQIRRSNSSVSGLAI